MQNPFIVPTNRTLISEESTAHIREFEVGANATPAEMIPGSIVIYDTTAGAVKESGLEAHTYIGILEVNSDVGPADHYAVGDQCRVITGECYCIVRLKANENVSVGEQLICGADGLAVAATTGLIGEQGATIGYALAASNVASIVRLPIHFLPSVEAQTAA